MLTRKCGRRNGRLRILPAVRRCGRIFQAFLSLQRRLPACARSAKPAYAVSNYAMLSAGRSS